MFHYRTFRERRLEPLHSSTAFQASENAVFDRNKSRTLADKVSFTLTVLDGEGKCCRMLPCAAKWGKVRAIKEINKRPPCANRGPMANSY